MVSHVDAQIKRCPGCQSQTKGQFPADMPGPLQYGAGIKAYVLNLLIAQMLSLKRVQQSIRTLIGIILSEATILKYVMQLHQALEKWEQHTIEKILAMPAMHVDETSLRVDRKNHWIHVCSAGDLTLKFLHPKRGKAAIETIGVENPATGWGREASWQDPGDPFYFGPDSRTLVGNAKMPGDETHYVYTMDVETGEMVQINDQGADACAHFYPDGKRLIWTSTRDLTDLPAGSYWIQVQNWTGTDGILEVYAGDKLVKRFLEIDKLSTALGTGDRTPRSYRFGYGILDANLNGVADKGEKKVYFEFSDYSTSYIKCMSFTAASSLLGPRQK